MCRSLGVWVHLFLIKLIEASKQNMSQTGDKHINETEKNIPNVVPYSQKCTYCIYSLPTGFSPPVPPHQKPHFHDKDRKAPRGASWLNAINAFMRHLDSEEEEKPASSQEDITKDKPEDEGSLEGVPVWRCLKL